MFRNCCLNGDKNFFNICQIFFRKKTRLIQILTKIKKKFGDTNTLKNKSYQVSTKSAVS